MYTNKEGTHLLACPNCNSIDLEQLKQYRDQSTWEKDLTSDHSFQEGYGERFPDALTSPKLICGVCHEYSWHSGDNPLHSFGVFPEEKATKIFIKPQDPEIDKLCNYPVKCYCGECPNPNQIEFNLHGAAKEDDSTLQGRLGRCYQLAGRRAAFESGDPDLHLVHGTIQNFENPPIGHAWVEHSNGEIYEPATNEVFPKIVFDALFNPTEEARYHQSDINKIILKHGHWGPWHDTEGNQ